VEWLKLRRGARTRTLYQRLSVPAAITLSIAVSYKGVVTLSTVGNQQITILLLQLNTRLALALLTRKFYSHCSRFDTVHSRLFATSICPLKPLLNMLSSVVRWGALLQARRLRVRFPMRSMTFFNLHNSSIRTMALGLTQPVTEMSTRSFWGRAGAKRGLHLRLMSLTPSMSRLSWKCGSLDISEPYRPPRYIGRIALL
jgi:hypothetical protein